VVSDGIIAPGYEPAALAILSAKKSGNFIVLQATANYTPPDVEYREVQGAVFAQKRNNALVTLSNVSTFVTQAKEVSDGAKLDLVVASIAIK
jgi:phosphoribosylaminoimidazolecarboxamide formyltransferase/IMP cyclohydrolase